MTTKYPIPAEALDKHIAFLGSTGSGKTSTTKSASVEGASGRDERVIISGKGSYTSSPDLF